MSDATVEAEIDATWLLPNANDPAVRNVVITVSADRVAAITPSLGSGGRAHYREPFYCI